MRMPLTLLCAASTLLVFSAVSLAQPAPARDAAYYDIGGFHQPVTTNSAEAQTWFDRGLAMCYGFNHEEAVRCFEKALAADPAMPMGYWGIAYALGPNINNMETPPHQVAQADMLLKLAKLHAAKATPLAQSLIDALAKRYASPAPEDRGPLNLAYADAMRKVYEANGNSAMVATLFAESLMNLQPWKHWSVDGKPAEHTAEIVTVLEQGLAKWPEYAGLCHLYIHAMEASPTPEKALTAANNLWNAIPGAGHLVHMPSHIYVLVGDYDNAVTCNQEAIAVDNDFVNKEGAHNFYTLYRVHNHHFVVYGAMFDGQSEVALQAAREIVKTIPADMLKAQVDFLDAFVPTALHVLVRFGRWEEILAEPEPDEGLPVTRSIWHYSRALAYAATGRVPEAEAEQQKFAAARDTVPETSFLFQNPSRNILGVAEAMLAGEIAYRRGEHTAAFEHLREAVKRDDALNYDEPWGWMQPARHALGALLLEQGQATEAEDVFRADLKRHPNNPWALHGLAESLEKQKKTAEVDALLAKFEDAVKRADVTIDRSCYCRIRE